jgi:endonuclease/exonuclease/phosphatase family metal-dependent hydrolase
LLLAGLLPCSNRTHSGFPRVLAFSAQVVNKLPRILSYNVHSCLGMDGSLSPQRIAEVIAPCQPDIVCLQELDVGRVRTRGVDQAHVIARELGMHVLFHAAMRVMEEEYGNAVLTILPAKLVKAGTLPGRWHRSALEPRGAL